MIDYNITYRVQVRRKQCEDIAAKARLLGFDVTWERVNRQYPIWERWDSGKLATGYLIRQTGIHRIERKEGTPDDAQMDV